MAKRRRTTTKRRRAPRRNPSRARRAGRRIARRAGGAVMGLNFRTALGNIPIQTAGMLAAKWAAKRFGGGAIETDNASWTWRSYLQGAAGAAGAGILLNMFRRGWGQKALEGGMSLMLYETLQRELIPQSNWATNQFGQAGERVPGVIEENEAGQPFVLGEDYQWYPLTGADDDIIPSIDGYGYGSSLVEPGPLGDELVPVGPMGAAGSSFLRR